MMRKFVTLLAGAAFTLSLMAAPASAMWYPGKLLIHRCGGCHAAGCHRHAGCNQAGCNTGCNTMQAVAYIQAPQQKQVQAYYGPPATQPAQVPAK